MSATRVLLVLAGVAMLSACSGEAEPKLSIMGNTPADLPAWVSGSSGLPVKNLTHVADVDRLKVFASRDDDNNWCVVLAIEPTSQGSDWAASASCAPSERFSTDGVWIEATSSGNGGAALLLPDDFSGEVADDWDRVNDNLAIRQ